MALTDTMLSELAPFLDRDVGGRIASMGYPDIIASELLVRHLLRWNNEAVEERPDSAAICRRHGIPSRSIPEAQSFFRLLGYKLDVFDIVKKRGCEIIADLNYPLDVVFVNHTGYDFVLDVGTLEHCFNIAQAALNMAGLLNERGIILHENPFNWGNHGFYNLNPTWYSDFYSQPGFEVIDIKMITKQGEQAQDVPRTERFQFKGPEVNMFAIARRTEILPIKFPQQTKYKGA